MLTRNHDDEGGSDERRWARRGHRPRHHNSWAVVVPGRDRAVLCAAIGVMPEGPCSYVSVMPGANLEMCHPCSNAQAVAADVS